MLICTAVTWFQLHQHWLCYGNCQSDPFAAFPFILRRSGHSHDCMAQVHAKTGGEAQEWVRAMLSTCGRGGNAQAVRDEILNIMHRNNIGEKRGTWMEARPSSIARNTCRCRPFMNSSLIYAAPAV